MYLKTLGEYVLEHPEVEKQVLMKWMQQILVQLQAMEQIRELPDTITPFHIMIRENTAVVQVDLEEEKIPSYSVLGKFVPSEGQNSSVYSFGKTMQFLLAKTKLVPRLTRRQEFHFQKIISKCLTNKSKKQYRKFSEIELNFPKRKKCIIAIVLGVILVFGKTGMYYMKQEQITADKEQEYFEQGVSCFLFNEDYEKSKELFEKVQSKSIGLYFAEMSSYMAETSECTDLEMEIILNEAAKLLEVQEGVEEKACLVRTYEKVDTPNARRKIETLVTEAFEDIPWNETRREMREILANVYLREGEYEKALREYQTLLTESEYEEICKIIKNLKKKTQ